MQQLAKKLEPGGYCETSVHIPTTRRYIPADGNIISYRACCMPHPRTLLPLCRLCHSRHLLIHSEHACHLSLAVCRTTHPPYVTSLRSRRAWQITVSRHSFICGSWWEVSEHCVQGPYSSSVTCPLVVKRNRRLQSFEGFRRLFIFIPFHHSE
jgi:hypothetical protein